MPFSPYRHFERKRDIFFVRDRSGKVRTADNGKHRIPSDFILGRRFLRKRRAALLSSLRFDFSLFLPKAQIPCYNG